MKKMKIIFSILIMTVLLSATVTLSFAADDDLPVPRVIIQPVI